MNLRKHLSRLARYPAIARILANVFGLFEVPILELLSSLDKHTGFKFFDDLMPKFTKVYGSRIIPLGHSLQAVPAVSPTEEIISVVRRVESVALGYCYCRAKSQNCENDVWTCIHIGTAKSLDEIASKKPLRSADHDEIEKVIRKAHDAGLVHQLITAPNSEFFYVICNCCPCCCVMLRSAIEYDMSSTVLSSNFIANVDTAKCNDCGRCISRCHFGAHEKQNEIVIFDPENCVGCGLCISTCPIGAIHMVRRERGPLPGAPLDMTRNQD